MNGLLYLCAGLLLPFAVQAGLNMVATTPDLAALAQEIGGERVTITTLARPTEDPHFVDPKPSFIVKLNRAEALIEGGAELEMGWLPALLDRARNPKIAAGAPGRIAGAQGVALLEVPASLDRARGDLHALGNPHFLTDPLNAKIVSEHICEVLCRLDATGAEIYRANLAKFNARLEAKLAEWQKLLAPYAGRRVAAYHNTWPYFARRFGLRSDLFLEPKTGIPPTPAHLAEVIAQMKAEGIRVIIVEPYQNRKTALAVAAGTGATVLDFAQYPGGVTGTESGYIELMDYLVKSLAKALANQSKRH
jgi:zinc/manganese transport system substrate-binding protein